MSPPLTVRSKRKPWVTPSTKRTEIGAAEAGRSHTSTVTRTSKQSVAALVNNMTVEQGMCAPTRGVPELCHRQLRRLFQSTEHLKASAPSWLCAKAEDSALPQRAVANWSCVIPTPAVQLSGSSTRQFRTFSAPALLGR